MRQVSAEISRISGRGGRSCYTILGYAVEAVLPHGSKDFKMGDICEEVARAHSLSSQTVSQALSRAARDSWEYGQRENLEDLMGHALCEKPSPKDLVKALADRVRAHRGEQQVEYHVLEAGIPRRYGIWGRAVGAEAVSAASMPFTGDREEAACIAERLNREQLSIETFRDLFLRRELQTLL